MDSNSLNLKRIAGNYALGHVLGVGASGEVRLGQHVVTGEVVAVKIVENSRWSKSFYRDSTDDEDDPHDDYHRLETEIAVLQQLDHIHISRLKEVIYNVPFRATWCQSCACTEYQQDIGSPLGKCSSCSPHTQLDHSLEETRTVTLLVLELALGGELFSILGEIGNFSESFARLYFRQMCQAVQHCHQQGVVHRDLKMENLVLDHHYNLKIIDFGLSAHVSPMDPEGRPVTLLSSRSPYPVEQPKELRGLDRSPLRTPNEEPSDPAPSPTTIRIGFGCAPYAAPEAMYPDPNGKGYHGEPADVWAAAVILYIFLTGRPPFRRPLHRTIDDTHRRCEHFRSLQAGYYPDSVPVQARTLLTAMFNMDPLSRPDLKTILADPWVQGPLPDGRDLQQSMYQTISAIHTKKNKPCLSNVMNRLIWAENLNCSILGPDTRPSSSVPALSIGANGADSASRQRPICQNPRDKEDDANECKASEVEHAVRIR